MFLYYAMHFKNVFILCMDNIFGKYAWVVLQWLLHFKKY